MEQNNDFKEYIDSIPVILNTKKKISLYKAMKTCCPYTVKVLNKRVLGENKKIIPSREDRNKWYVAFLNFLQKKEILEKEVQNENTTIHNVNQEWQKYFVVKSSTTFSQQNIKEHLFLYEENYKEFFTKIQLLDKNGKEILNTKEKNNAKTISEKLSDKHKKIINAAGFSLLAWTIIDYILLISKYGLNNLIEIIVNCFLFTLAIIIITKIE